MPTRYTQINAGSRTFLIDRQAKAVFNGSGELHHMTLQQFHLLELFVSHPQNMLLTQEQLRLHLYNKANVNDEAVPNAVKYLRKSLGSGFIQTDHGKGYRLISEINHYPDGYFDKSTASDQMDGPRPANVVLQNRRSSDRQRLSDSYKEGFAKLSADDIRSLERYSKASVIEIARMEGYIIVAGNDLYISHKYIEILTSESENMELIDRILNNNESDERHENNLSIFVAHVLAKNIWRRKWVLDDLTDYTNGMCILTTRMVVKVAKALGLFVDISAQIDSSVISEDILYTLADMIEYRIDEINKLSARTIVYMLIKDIIHNSCSDIDTKQYHGLLALLLYSEVYRARLIQILES